MSLSSEYSVGVRNASDAHSEAMALPIDRVVAELTDLLGATTVATIGGVKETRAVQQWSDGEREPQRAHALRFALQLALMICDHTSRDLARAWFHGSNPHTDDRVPVVMLRDGDLEHVQTPLMLAARAFAARERA